MSYGCRKPTAPDVIKTDVFTFNIGAQKAFSEFSTMGIPAGRVPKWMTLKSHKTGELLDVYIQDTQYDDSGDNIVAYMYKPHSLPYRNNDFRMEDWQFIVFND